MQGALVITSSPSLWQTIEANQRSTPTHECVLVVFSVPKHYKQNSAYIINVLARIPNIINSIRFVFSFLKMTNLAWAMSMSVALHSHTIVTQHCVASQLLPATTPARIINSIATSLGRTVEAQPTLL